MNKITNTVTAHILTKFSKCYMTLKLEPPAVCSTQNHYAKRF
jgi:CheY-specific phosphatase CheX